MNQVPRWVLLVKEKKTVKNSHATDPLNKDRHTEPKLV